jgi:hypothetical protein
MSQIEEAGGDKIAAGFVHCKLSEWVVADNFTPYPEDNLHSVYGIAEEELDEDIILCLFEEMKIPLPSRDFLAVFGAVDTPLKIAQLVSSSRGELP